MMPGKIETRMIATIKVGGRDRKVVMTMGKMGILEVMDAATGGYLFSIDAGTQNIITAIDPKTGAKTIDPSKLPDPSKVTVCPTRAGPYGPPASATGGLFSPRPVRVPEIL